MDAHGADGRATGWDAFARPTHGAHETSDPLAGPRLLFPVTSSDAPIETGFHDWQARLARNLARRSDGRWEPLTWVHAGLLAPADERPSVLTDEE